MNTQGILGARNDDTREVCIKTCAGDALAHYAQRQPPDTIFAMAILQAANPWQQQG